MITMKEGDLMHRQRKQDKSGGGGGGGGGGQCSLAICIVV